MKKQKGRYYLSRVIKLGELTQDKLMAAVLNAPVLRIGKFDWAFTDALDGRKSGSNFVFGKLAKYSSEGHVMVVDPANKSQQEALAPNLLVASSPFVYLPDFSGVAFLHVWNGIQEELFPKRFCSLVQAAYENFFVECSVEPVADYRAFVEKLNNLERITEMSAKVHPPNPLFGHQWEKLKEYIEHRNAEEISIREKKMDGSGINSELLPLMQNLLNKSHGDATPDHAIDITDAAMLMAADGYGNGKIVGEQDGETVVIRTSDTHKSFVFAKEPEPIELANAAAKYFEVISKERDMAH
ncbi:MAG: hypothetical protein WKF61_01755 [Luteimonas sp.]